MAFSYRIYTADGATASFPVPFPYLERTHVRVLVDGTPQSLSAYEWTSPSQIALVTVPPVGAVVRIERNTPRDTGAVNFQNAALLKSGDLNTGNRQLLFVIQEILDEITEKVEAVPAIDNVNLIQLSQLALGPHQVIGTNASGNLTTLATTALFRSLFGADDAAEARAILEVPPPPPRERVIAAGFEAPIRNNEVLLRYRSVEDLTLPANLAGWGGDVTGTALTGSLVLTLHIDGVTAGSITFGPTGGPTFTTTSGEPRVVAAGAELTITAPANAEAVAAGANISISGKGTY